MCGGFYPAIEAELKSGQSATFRCCRGLSVAAKAKALDKACWSKAGTGSRTEK
jgi:hypothetical protein